MLELLLYSFLATSPIHKQLSPDSCNNNKNFQISSQGKVRQGKARQASSGGRSHGRDQCILLHIRRAPPASEAANVRLRALRLTELDDIAAMAFEVVMPPSDAAMAFEIDA